MGVVSNAITLLEIKSEAQGMIIGGIIIAAAVLDVLRTRKTRLSDDAFVFVMGLVSTFMLACGGRFVEAKGARHLPAGDSRGHGVAGIGGGDHAIYAAMVEGISGIAAIAAQHPDNLSG